MAFKLAQTFYVDKGSVRNSENVTLTSLDLYFKSKPRATANRSGIKEPGVTIQIVETSEGDIPNTNSIVENAVSRNEYASIVATSDASIVTKFNFQRPVVIKTNKSYAITVLCDGDEDYVLWTCKEGENVVGTNVVTAGATGPNIGKYYEYNSSVYNENTGNSASNWKALTNVDLKFSVYCAVFANSVSNTEIKTTYVLPCDPVEYIMFDRYDTQTVNWKSVNVGEYVYQETPILYGPIKVQANNKSIKATGGINFSNLLTTSSESENNLANTSPEVGQKSYIVLRNGSNQNANVTIREVVEIVSNTEIRVDRLPDFTNSAATFSVTAVGKVEEVKDHWYDGRYWDGSSMVYRTNHRTDLVKVSDTNANSTNRFVNNMVKSIAISSGGTGYSNSDVLTIYPTLNANTANSNHISYIKSYANAVANVVTNGSGTITGIALSNTGFGLISDVNYSISTSSGVSANLVISTGSVVKTEKGGKAFGDTNVINVETHRAFPSIKIKGNQHHEYKLYQHYPYYVLPGKEHLIQKVSGTASVREVSSYTNVSNMTNANTDKRKYILASRSNEVVQTGNVAIKTANGSTLSLNLKSSSVLEVSITSNNAFSLPMIESDVVYNFKYIVNNTSADENKAGGTSLARHISKRVTFAEGRTAEDLIVYVDAYRPAGTNLKVYAKLHNANDKEAFDDKDWTELELRSNNANKYSSKTNKNDLVEYTYGLKTTVPSVNTIAGFATVTANSSVVTGVNTNFASDLQAGDIVKIYSTLFPENYIITPVTAVTNATSMTIEEKSTVDLAGSTTKIDFIGRAGDEEIGTPHAAWIYKANSYVSRYYDLGLAAHNGYNSFAIKTVLLTNDTTVIPEIENMRAVGVSA